MVHRIEIDDEVYAHLEAHVRGFEQPNDVLRRLLLAEAEDAPRPKVGALGAGRLQPLLDAKLVVVGDQLSHTQVRKGNTFTAVVDHAGWVATDRGTYKEPSPALRDLLGTQVDGWKHWIHVPSGKSLRTLREELRSTSAK